MADIQPLVDAAAWYLQVKAYMALAEPFLGVGILLGMAYGLYRFVRAIM